MKVPIEVEDEKSEVVEPDEVTTEEAGDESPETPEEVDEEAEERARVEAAIRAGEEAAERELAADADRIRSERDELQRKLSEVEDQIESAKKDAAEAKDRLVRLQADWDNYRRRTAAERLVERERAAEGLVTNLLPVIDDIERAIEHAGATEENAQLKQFVDGVSAVHAKMLAVLAKEGVEPIDPAGEPFEPLAHQAVGRVEDKDAYDETVAQVYQKGYRMGDKVIRTAMVTVTYGGPKRPTEDPAAGEGEAAEQAETK
ncbi:nucleotide exchange factor GrpE [Thermophilibacter mediterraneus]|uniref:nucleotide exchange factor GrpE n=1 Tax=Thermophilibacter mediterraneus TaxID=1871031 RepID=UPI0009FAE8B9|nr:nucleotide exchange factor GrpE [Thermophilibacter mediterraneus]